MSTTFSPILSLRTNGKVNGKANPNALRKVNSYNEWGKLKEVIVGVADKYDLVG